MTNLIYIYIIEVDVKLNFFFSFYKINTVPTKSVNFYLH
jgi:hypothetical protein